MRYYHEVLISLFVIATVVALSSCKSNMPSHIVAEINGDTITVEEFSAELSPFIEGYHLSPSTQEEAALKNLKQALLDQLIEKRLILNEAQQMGITVSDDELEEAFASIQRSYPQGGFDEVVRDEAALHRWKERLRQRLVIEKVINRVSQVTVPLDEDVLRKYYKEHQSEFMVPEQVRVRQIVTKDRQTAESVLSKVKRGDSFEELAKRHSVAPEAEQGGDLGFFGRGDMPEEFDVVFSLQAGETSEIVQSPYGYHIFQVVAKEGRSELNFAEVKDRIREIVVREEEEKIFQDWLKKVKKKAIIRINTKALEELRIPPPQEKENKENQ
jgi:parvulin-like peptidyl-prolyl isomerase